MELSLIQKDILITLITLYHRKSVAIKGEEIAELLKRNPGTLRNQMQALKALGLVEGVPGPKGGYTPSSSAYNELNLLDYEKGSDVPLQVNGEYLKSVNVAELDFTTLCHPDLCHAVVRIIGSVKGFNIGDEITLGPTPVNKLLVKGEVYGKDEVDRSLLISISEMISLPKKQISHYMSSPVQKLDINDTIKDAIALFSRHHIHGAPIMDKDMLVGIVTLLDIAHKLDEGNGMDTTMDKIMTEDVVIAPPNINLFEVIERFKEQEIGRIVIVDGKKPIGILTQSDILKVFPSP
ncbi:CBS domain-containing protein [Methanolacinia petrolearia]|uniref:CBS domain-containing protein n=1 Tax=Methanolacinia petrolearia TaxID=54120 RepID=UPI003BAD01DA